MDSKLYDIIKKYGLNGKNDAPEATLFGCIKLCLMPDSALDHILDSEGIEDKDAVKASIKEVLTILDSKKLDTELMKKGLSLIALAKGADEETKYNEVVGKYGENTSMAEMVSDAIENIEAADTKELQAFQKGKEMSDVLSYRDTIAKKNKETKKAAAEEASKIEKESKEDEKESKDVAKDDAKSEDKKTEEDNSEAVAEEEEETFVYLESLRKYLEEFEEMIPKFKEMGNEKFLWSQSLLVAVDEGYGFTTFAKKLASILIKNGLVKDATVTVDNLCDEVELEAPSTDGNSGNPWNKAVTHISGMARRSSSRSRDAKDNKSIVKGVACIDISKWTGDIDTHEAKDGLKEINENNDSVFTIFRIPYMDRKIVGQVATSISDIMGVKTIVAPPAPSETMVDYIFERGNKNGFTFEEDCREGLIQGIIAEKNDGKYYGFRTLDKMFDTIIYEKIKYNYENNLSDKIINAEQLGKFLDVSVQEEETLEDMIKGLVGVDDIISELEGKIKQVKTSIMMHENGNSVSKPSIHMMFKGNPGTGKTTIARIVAKMMKEAGILSKGHVFEIKGRDLCGMYVGHTTPRTVAYCRDAYGSVLFIDEAYELYRGDNDRDYGREALTALVAEMENHRDDMCVIMAGYSAEMEQMLKGNPGMESRIPIIIEFPNYKKDELEQIFFKMVEKDFTYDDELKETAHKYFDSIPDSVLKAKEFSNARFVRNLFESVWGAAALRQDLTQEGSLVIKSCDFDAATSKINLEKYGEGHRPIGKIGFRV